MQVISFPQHIMFTFHAFSVVVSPFCIYMQAFIRSSVDAVCFALSGFAVIPPFFHSEIPSSLMQNIKFIFIYFLLSFALLCVGISLRSICVSMSMSSYFDQMEVGLQEISLFFFLSASEHCTAGELNLKLIFGFTFFVPIFCFAVSRRAIGMSVHGMEKEKWSFPRK